MARSPKYWYDIMIAEKNGRAQLNVYQPNIDSAQTFLDDLKSSSKVAIWRCLFWCVAVCAYSLDVVFDLFKLDLEAITASSRYGTLPWYVSIAKAYQHGDALVQIDLEWKYAAENLPAQIVKLAAANEVAGQVNVKVAKLSGTTPTQLSGPEEVGFTAYLQKKKPAGIYVNVINAAADELKLYLTINYNPLVFTATGALISNPAVKPAEDAVNAYLSGLDFDGKFELMKLVDKVQLALGDGSSVYVTNAEARYGANPFVPFSQSYSPNAGYMVIYSGTPLSATITYVPNV
jgi:hypothetical protein